MTTVRTLSREEVKVWRDVRYRRLPHLRVRTENEALTFLNDVGIATLFSSGDMELPSLWEAICGGVRSIPEQHNDHALGLTWDWKDTLPSQRKILYGKFLRKKPVFLSLDIFPAFYALSGNFGEVDDYVQQYEDGLLSEEARRVYEALVERGATPTSHLRQYARLAGKDSAPRFDRAVTELQMGFKIVKVGISDANRWKYCYVYDLLIRQFPEEVRSARRYSENEAADAIVKRYLSTVLLSTEQQMQRLFGWESWRIEQSLERVVRSGEVVAGIPVADETRGIALRSTLEQAFF